MLLDLAVISIVMVIYLVIRIYFQNFYNKQTKLKVRLSILVAIIAFFFFSRWWLVILLFFFLFFFFLFLLFIYLIPIKRFIHLLVDSRSCTKEHKVYFLRKTDNWTIYFFSNITIKNCFLFTPCSYLA
jgi:chromate transport protein ChrA